jgi:hypothetical protein
MGLQFNNVGGGLKRGPPIIQTGKDALARFGMDQRSIRDIIGYQIRLATSFWLLSYLGLTLTKQKYEVMQAPPIIADFNDESEQKVEKK